MKTSRAAWSRTWTAVTAAFVAALALLLVAAAVSSGDFVRARTLPLLALALVAGLAGLLAWRRADADVARWTQAAEAAERNLLTRTRERDDALRQLEEERRLHAAALEAERRHHLEELRALREELEEQLRAAREELEGKLAAQEGELVREREERSRIEHAREAERRWNQELRHEVAKMHREQGALGDVSDIRNLVLRIAVNLLGAEKGLLLSRQDDDSDGDLDMVSGIGFENDPEHSVIVQRFATEVLKRDETVREDEPSEVSDAQTPADREIENLVGIPIYIADRFSGVVVCANKPGGFREYDDDVLLALGDHAGAVLQNNRLQGELRNAYLSTVRLLAAAIEAKDPLRGHSDEISQYVASVADRLNLGAKSRETLTFGVLLRDIGKIGISERILLKPGPLSSEERSLVRLHPRIGYRLLRQVPALREIATSVLHHHERYDGVGYPSGLRGDEIPLESRIIAIADAFNAMISDRPFRERLAVADACAELERCAGTQFDGELVGIFVAEVRRRPPAEPDGGPLAEAFDDPELELNRDDSEPLLGYGSFATTDNLTLLYSHRYFHELAHVEAERSSIQNKPFAVVLVELTDIARINREHGYAVGDHAIKTAAEAVERAAVRTRGTAARYSGRRLGLIVLGADEAVAERLAAELASDLGEGPAIRVSWAAWRRGDSGEDVISHASESLVAAALPAAQGAAAS